MIRVKVISLRQALDNIIYILIVLLIVLLSILIIVLGIHIFKTVYKSNDFKKYYEMAKSENLIMNILQKEIPIFCWGTIDDDGLNSNVIWEQNKDVDEVFVELKKLEKKQYNLPSQYDVTTLENGKIKVGNMKLTNYSNLKLDFNELAKVKNEEYFKNPDFLIFHTHATECYSDSKEATDNYRTLNESYNVVEVGKVLTEKLIEQGYKVTHDKTLHDYPNYNGSYQASLKTVKKYLKEHEYDFVLDIHRDALGSDLNYSPTINVDGKNAAQLMFVIGTDACGLQHDNWMENLKIAIMIQNRANEMYPGLFRDLNLSGSRYNQHVSSGAFIIEVGATGNTLEEAENAMILLANIIDSF